jgi:hypothetical protein
MVKLGEESRTRREGGGGATKGRMGVWASRRAGVGKCAEIGLSGQRSWNSEESGGDVETWTKAEEIACTGQKCARIFYRNWLLSCKPPRGSYLFGPPKPEYPRHEHYPED